MKRLIFLAFVALSCSGFSQWTNISNGMPHDFMTSIYFTDASKGYIISPSGRVYRTIDAGSTWDTIIDEPVAQPTSIHFPDDNTGYIVGGNHFFKTQNGGSSWYHTWYDPSEYQFSSVFFISRDTGYVAGYNGRLHKTTDGGGSWISQNSGSFGTFFCVYFINESTGFIGAEYQTILQTVDGGLTWKKVTSSSSGGGGIRSIFFTDNSTGYAFGDGFYKSVDGGSSWSQLNSDIGGYSAHFSNDHTFYLVGGDSGDHCEIYKTKDGGQNWFSQYCGTKSVLRSVFFIDENTGYAVGEEGVILKTTNGGGGGIGMEDPETKSVHIEVYPNPASTEVTFKTPFMGSLYINTMNGEEVLHQEIVGTSITLDVRELPTGMYVAKLIGKGNILVTKYIKQ